MFDLLGFTNTTDETNIDNQRLIRTRLLIDSKDIHKHQNTKENECKIQLYDG